ncbi:hypothetical protein [Halomarina oriensis]|uniref:Uncharacterized protein n=1 Tax=Halomarina oriensis TaxID=671145 RepID=A0A6B0GJI7_9EURY|nr:hypothetical protein [Halomarina oriensis]MWG35086.1 hypothetical protein [Halomarina oriensis]
MPWHDLVFTAGSLLAIVTLAPTLTDVRSSVPRTTSVPSALVAFVYTVAFLTLGLTFSAVGSLMTGVLWGAIALRCAPGGSVDRWTVAQWAD